MKLIVGLGNPGRKYSNTRHNVGFRVMEELARRYAVGRARSRFEAEVVDATVEGQAALLLCPQTFMNLSGRSVRPAKDFYKIQDPDLLVVCDDFNLSLARLRFRRAGSSGGQKGLADILRTLGTQQIGRLRIGIGPPAEGWDVADFVLSRFNNQETDEIDRALVRAADGVVDWVRHGIDYCMNQYNQEEPPPA